MELTEILSQCLYKQYEELKTDAAYQAAQEASHQAEKALLDTLTPEQTKLFDTYIDHTSRLDSMELQHFFSRCSLILLPQSK